MKYVDELSHDEIASKLGISPAASRKRLSRALRLMRKSERIKKYKLFPFIIVLVVIAAILTACAVEPIRNFFMEVFREFTCFRKENTAITEVYDPDPMAFGYIPEGYSMVEKSLGDRTRLFIFSCEDADKSDFTVMYEFCRPINNNNANSEGGDTWIISINNFDCIVTTSSEIEETIATIYLTDSVIEYVGNLDYGEMTHFLEAINLLKQEKGE